MLRQVLTTGLLSLTIMATAACTQQPQPTPNAPDVDPQPAANVSDVDQRACNSPFGPADEIGAANYLTPEKAVQAAGLVKEGKTYDLALETNRKTTAYAPRSFGLVVTGPVGIDGAGPTKMNYLEDSMFGSMGVGSQIDGLGHMGFGETYYNCNNVADFYASDGLKKLGVENIPNMVTRGIVLDMTGEADMLEMGKAFNSAEIQAQAERQGVEITKGDVVLFHTGWGPMAQKDPEAFLAGQPGLGVEGAQWLAEKGVVAIGSDTAAVDAYPGEKGAGEYEVHQVLLAEHGIYILEMMVTQNLVDDGVSEAMFVLGTPKITGAVQSIVNPTMVR